MHGPYDDVDVGRDAAAHVAEKQVRSVDQAAARVAHDDVDPADSAADDISYEHVDPTNVTVEHVARADVATSNDPAIDGALQEIDATQRTSPFHTSEEYRDPRLLAHRAQDERRIPRC